MKYRTHIHEETGVPTEMVVDGQVYAILSCLWSGDLVVSGYTIIERAREMGANLDEEECDRLLAHEDQIHVKMRGKFILFTEAMEIKHPPSLFPYDKNEMRCIRWNGSRWVKSTISLLNGGGWGAGCWVLRLKRKALAA